MPTYEAGTVLDFSFLELQENKMEVSKRAERMINFLVMFFLF